MTDEIETVEAMVARAAKANLELQDRFAYREADEPQAPTWERRTLASLPLRYRESLGLEASRLRTQGGTGMLDLGALRLALAATERTMMLSGNSRIGKSVIAARVLMHRCRARQVQGFWVGATELALEMREHGLGDTAPTVRKARELRVLVLDDLGRETGDGDVKLLVNDLLERRIARGLDTIVTTGLTRADIVDRYGTGTWERLTEGGQAIAIVPRFRAAA